MSMYYAFAVFSFPFVAIATNTHVAATPFLTVTVEAAEIEEKLFSWLEGFSETKK